jgi:hypothetical protein
MEKKINAFNASVIKIQGVIRYFAILIKRVLKEIRVNVSDILNLFVKEEQL